MCDVLVVVDLGQGTEDWNVRKVSIAEGFCIIGLLRYYILSNGSIRHSACS